MLPSDLLASGSTNISLAPHEGTNGVGSSGSGSTEEMKAETKLRAPCHEKNEHSYVKISRSRPHGRGAQRILSDDVHEEVEPHDGHGHTNDWDLI